MSAHTNTMKLKFWCLQAGKSVKVIYICYRDKENAANKLANELYRFLIVMNMYTKIELNKLIRQIIKRFCCYWNVLNFDESSSIFISFSQVKTPLSGA